MAGFFDRVKAAKPGKKPGYPRFKPHTRFNQVSFVAGDGAKWEPADDFHHKTARTLVDTCDAIGLEDLRVADKTRSARGTAQQPGRNVAQKAGLNRSILDAGWAQFTSILAAKAEEAGRRVVNVNPAHTSIDCHACGARCTRPRQDTVVCPRCGPRDADVNGARNVCTRAGLGSGQADA